MTLAQAIHDQKCHSYRAGNCEGTGHVSQYHDLARRVRASDNPALTLHDAVCDAQIDPTVLARGGCPDADRHIKHLARWLALHDAQGVLDLEGMA